MKDKRNFVLPSNKLINKFNSNIAELLEFNIVGEDQRVFRYLVNIQKVLQVMPMPKLHTPRQGKSHVIGKVLIRSHPVPVVCLGSYLSIRRLEDGYPTDLVVLSFLGSYYGMLVDSVQRIHYVSWSDLMSSNSRDESGHEIGMMTIDQDVFSVIDFEKVIVDLFEGFKKHMQVPLETTKQRGRVGVIDDSSVSREMIRNSLMNCGFDIECYSSANEFLERQEQHFIQYRCLVIDVEMPGINGLVLVDKLRTDYRYNDVFMSMYSSIADPAIYEKAKKAGANKYIIKYDFSHLEREIIEYLEQVT